VVVTPRDLALSNSQLEHAHTLAKKKRNFHSLYQTCSAILLSHAPKYTFEVSTSCYLFPLTQVALSPKILGDRLVASGNWRGLEGQPRDR